MDRYDVAVVGAGSAGLAGAVALARSRRSVLVVDGGPGRNASAGHVHNYLGREGATPEQLRAVGRSEAQAYGATVVDGTVRDAVAVDSGFDLDVDGRTVRVRRLLVTAGLVDALPDVPGLAEHWGSGVLHCPYCHGWEVRDRAIGVLVTSPLAGHVTQLFRQLSDRVVVLQHTGPELAEQARLEAMGVGLVEGEVVAVESDGGRLSGVRLASGEVVPLDHVVVGPVASVRPDLLPSLGLRVVDQVFDGHVIGSVVETDALGRTSVSGVWAAGNVADWRSTVVGAAAAGMQAGAVLNGDLVHEDGDRAEARAREATTLAG